MTSGYKHGAYGLLGASVAQSALQVDTTTVYIGRAPVNLIFDYKSKNLVNTIIKVIDDTSATQKLGYCEDWASFDLCEPVAAHFKNRNGNIGPVFFINVLDPDIHRKVEQTKKNIAFLNGRAEFKSDKIILDTFVIADKTKDVDYSLDYNYTKNTVMVKSLKTDEPLKDTVEVAFYEVAPQMATKDDIIGGVSAGGEYSGIGVIDKMYEKTARVTNLIVCPGFSHIPAVYSAMVEKSDKLNGHWHAFSLVDIPVVDGDKKIDTIDAAINWKREKGYNSERSKPCWPQFVDATTEKIYHASVMAAVEYMRQDNINNGIPGDTCSNKPIPITGLYFGEGSKNQGYDQQTANELTQEGIMTAVFWENEWVLWGGHTGEYKYGVDNEPRCIFDTYIRMLFHIINMFQKRQGKTIAKGFNLQQKDTILRHEQGELDDYVAKGFLLPGAKIEFLASENSTSDMVNGDFMFNTPVTVTPQIKSLTSKVYYTDSGLKSLVEGV